MRIRDLFPIATAANLLAHVVGLQCSNFDSNMGATFDLTDLVRCVDIDWLYTSVMYIQDIRRAQLYGN